MPDRPALSISDTHLTTSECAAFLHMTERALGLLHAQHDGPPRVRIGKGFYYRKTALADWIEARERRQAERDAHPARRASA